VGLISRAPIVVTRVAAADDPADALFIARAGLKRAIAMREHATTQAEQVRALAARLEAERRAAL